MTDILLFATAINSRIRKWVSGQRRFKRDGDEFVREMIQMKRCQEDKTHFSFECYTKRPYDQRFEFKDKLEYTKPKQIALFCHGSKNWIYGIGYAKWNIHKLAQHIAAVTDNVIVILYACSCGGGRGNQYPVGKVPKKAGIAMLLADELAKRNVQFKIIAHPTRGHTTKNPNAVFIERVSDLIVRNRIVKFVSRWRGRKDPNGRKRWLNWVDLLRNTDTFRFRFPYMTKRQIHEMLDDVEDSK